MCCLFQRVGKPRAFPRVLGFCQDPVPSSLILDVGKNLVFPWKFSPVHKYSREWDLSGLVETWINVELSGMTSMLGFKSWRIHEFPGVVCRGLENFRIMAGMREFPPKRRGYFPFGMAGIAQSQFPNSRIQQLLLEYRSWNIPLSCHS